MRKKLNRITGFVLLLAALTLISAPVSAQTYAFTLEQEIIHVYWESDGTLSLTYELVMHNSNYGDPIDYVDIGMPNANFSISNATASVDGKPINHLAASPYVTNGIEIGLGSNAIQPGETGTLQFSITGIRDVLYQDSDDSDYVSAVFSPSWIDSEFVSGTTDISITYHLPPGVTPEEPRWHTPAAGFPETPYAELDPEGRVTYTWRNPNANGYTQYLFGASFPASYVPATAISTPTFWENIGIAPDDLIGGVCMCLFGSMFVAIPALSIRNAQKRKMKYLPPKLAIEGHGIKRGLTAVEAAIVLEQPMDKIMTMILFSTIKKGAARVISRDPLTIETTDPLPEDLRAYEKTFLTAMTETNKAKQKKDLQEAMVSLVRSVAKAMKGFSQRETRNYYKKITEAAWAQVEETGTPEVKSETYDKVMEWTMLDDDYDDRTRRVFRTGPVFLPTWWHHYSPGTMTSTSGPSKTAAPTMRPTPGGTSMPSLPGSEFAGSIVTGVQDFATGVIGSVGAFTSGVTNRTNPIPKSSSSGSRSGGGFSSGGSSCACACACAGCACACAGGGR
ncbi:MAG: hypothetical protein JW757_06940 [Anaerolineales bacterium]|nr:hypothetical protein [Anaerolineales bacterium]